MSPVQNQLAPQVVLQTKFLGHARSWVSDSSPAWRAINWYLLSTIGLLWILVSMTQSYRVSLPQTADKGKSLSTKEEDEPAGVGVRRGTEKLFLVIHITFVIFLKTEFILIIVIIFFHLFGQFGSFCGYVCAHLQMPFILFFGTISLTDLEFINTGWPVSPFPSPQCWSYKYRPPYLAFLHGLWQSIMLV